MVIKSFVTCPSKLKKQMLAGIPFLCDTSSADLVNSLTILGSDSSYAFALSNSFCSYCSSVNSSVFIFSPSLLSLMW